MPQSEIISLVTKDNVRIHGNYYPGGSGRGVLLLHMMPADRTSWIPFAGKLQEAGFHAFAIDLRGHGSSQGGPDGYKKFSDKEHQASFVDVEKAAEWFLKKGIEILHIAGASIGANLAVQYGSKHPEDTASMILLSPGLDYRGIRADVFVQDLAAGQAVFFVASSRDVVSSAGQSAVEIAQKLYDACPSRKDIRRFEGDEHGTRILEKYPEFMDELVEWLLILRKEAPGAPYASAA